MKNIFDIAKMNIRFDKIFLIISILILSVSNSYSSKNSNEKIKNYSDKSLQTKVDSLMSLMTLDEKIGQMVQVDIKGIKDPNEISKYSLGSILCGGDSEINDITATGWANYYDMLQSYALKSRLKIPIIFGVDAVHGHNNVEGAVIFPHNIGIGCTRNTKLAELEGKVTAEEIAGTGMDWDFAPCIAVVRDIRWGRTYEGYGESPELVSEMGAAFIKGMQNFQDEDGNNIIACAKHFIGDGGTKNGKDQGNTVCDEKTLRKIFLPPYREAIKAGVKTIMVSYSSWNGLKMHENKYLLTDVLKNELGFKGFLISDWAAIDQLGKNYKHDIEESINAGLDMVMVPNGPDKKNNFVEFISDLKELVNQGKVPLSRINDAVRRILTVKFSMNIFEHPFTDRKYTNLVGSKEHREIARECVRQSLVLLKNSNNILPLSKNIKSLVVAGESADNLGYQCGGWTISWQGGSGNIIKGGTTILQGIKNAVSHKTNIIFSKDGKNIESADAAIVVVGEKPYAEGKGDRKNLNLDKNSLAIIKRIKGKGIPVIVVLISGRPMLINDALKYADAFVAAWLPGTEGEGVSDVLFGDYKPTGKLSHSWPKSMKQIPINFGNKNYDPLFEYGFGLTY
jgi:beta-glucosidase